MAAAICTGLVISLPPISSGTAAGSRTYTATRYLQMFDLKCIFTSAPAPGAVTFTVTTPAGTCITKVTGAVPAINDVARLGDNASDRCVIANSTVTSGQTIVFTNSGAATAMMSLSCWPLSTI